LARIKDFITEAEKLKDEPRRGWKLKARVKHPESVAEHTYGVAILAMLLADERGLDAEKCMKMALLHDLSEVITGDMMPGENSNKRVEEDRAARKLLKKLPHNISKRYLEIWNEFKSGKSKEAKLVHEIDKLEMVIQASRYRRDGVKKELLARFVNSARTKVSDRTLKRMFEDFATASLK
jgi:putative hydrolase of HD superfamily